MKTKVVIKVLLFIFILLLIIIIYNIINIIVKKNNNDENININYNIQNSTNTTLETEEILESEGVAQPEDGYNNSDYIYYNEQEVIEYNNSQLDNINFNIVDIPNEISDYVINIESVKKQIKKYIYLNGLIDSTIANYKTHQISEENDKIAILFELNNKKKTQIIVKVNKKDNLVEISER